MAVKLRLRRMGKKRQPIYKVVAADVRSPRDGRFIEAIGVYNPKSEPATIDINEDRALYWLGVGAEPTVTVKRLLNKKGNLLKRNMIQKGVQPEEIQVKMQEWLNAAEAKNSTKKKVKENKPVDKNSEVTGAASNESAS